jgi:hypothetical protein
MIFAIYHQLILNQTIREGGQINEKRQNVEELMSLYPNFNDCDSIMWEK